MRPIALYTVPLRHCLKRLYTISAYNIRLRNLCQDFLGCCHLQCSISWYTSFLDNSMFATWMSFHRNPSSTSRCWVIPEKENRFKSCTLSIASLYRAQNLNEKTLLDVNANKVKTRSQRVCWIISALSWGNSKICALQLTTENNW